MERAKELKSRDSLNVDHSYSIRFCRSAGKDSSTFGEKGI